MVVQSCEGAADGSIMWFNHVREQLMVVQSCEGAAVVQSCEGAADGGSIM